MTWTYVEAPAALSPVQNGRDALSSQIMAAERASVPTYARNAKKLAKFSAEYRNVKSSGSAGSPKYLRKIEFDAAARVDRFFELRVSPWSCVYFIDQNSSICVALFSFCNQDRKLSGQKLLEYLAVPKSVLIASSFGFLERLIISWLKSEKGISIP